MANVTVQQTTNFHPERAPAVIDEETRVRMTEAVELRKVAVKENAPRDTGTFQASIEGSVEAEGSATRGDVFSTDEPKKVGTLEGGAPPGAMRSVERIRDWAAIRGISPFVVARSISQRGSTARQPFQKAVDQTEKEVDSILLDQLPIAIIERV